MSKENIEALKVNLKPDGSVEIHISAVFLHQVRASIDGIIKAIVPVEIVQPKQPAVSEPVMAPKPPPQLPSQSSKQKTAPHDYLSVREVGQQYGVSDRTVWRWISGFDLPHYRIGRMMRLKADEVREWVEKQQRRR